MSFEKIKKNFGFGFMRLPTLGDELDMEQITKMVDAFMEAGFNYFDTAHPYTEKRSEPTLRKTLVERYPRESFVLTNKLSGNCFKTEEDILPFFQMQLENCGVEYFDFYLMHALNADSFARYNACHAFEIVSQLKAEGKVRHMGISFHDKAEVLDRILTERPEIEVVQLQFNYLDYEDASVQSRLCYEVCRKHGKPVIVMEPVKGGRLAKMGPEMCAPLTALGGGSPASYAVRFAAGFEGIFMVLSGMSTLEMVEENCGFMADYKPLNEAELAAVDQVCKNIRAQHLIDCTGCRYCVEGCPVNIAIPTVFSCLNTQKQFADWSAGYYYKIYTQNAGSPADCVGCGQCEEICPQHLPIRQLLQQAAEEFKNAD